MADINLSWDLDERQLLEGLNRIERRLNDIEDEFEQVREAGDEAFSGATRRSRQMNADLSRSSKSAGGLSKAFGFLGGAAKIALGAAATGATVAAGRAVKLAAEYQKVQASFTTFLGSVDRANVVLAELETFSLETPFTPTQVQEAARSLLAFGIQADELAPALQNIGDVAAGTGKDFNELSIIYGKARVQGTLFAEDINQLTEAGVDVITQFANQFDITKEEVKKLASEGKISFKNLEEALEAMTNEGGNFNGQMARLAQTLPGQLSTLQGYFDSLLRDLGEETLPIIQELVAATIDFVRALSAEDIVKFFEPIKNELVPALENLYDSFVQAAQGLFGVNTEAEVTDAFFKTLANTFNAVVDVLTIAVNLLAGVSNFVTIARDAFISIVGSIIEFTSAIFGAEKSARELGNTLTFGLLEALDKISKYDFRTLIDFATAAARITVGLGGDVSDFANIATESLERQKRASQEFRDEQERLREEQKRLSAERAAQAEAEAQRRLKEQRAAEEALKATRAAALENEKLNKVFKELTKTVNELSAELAEIANEARFELLSEEAKAAFTFDEQRREIVALKDDIVALYDQLGKPLPDAFLRDYQDAIGGIQRQLFLDLFGITDKDIEEISNRQDTFFENLIKKIDANTTKQVEQYADSLRTRSPIRVALQNLFRLDDEEFDQLIADSEEQLNFAIGAITNALDAATEAQLSQQDLLISKIDERISKQQELVDAEKALAEEGFANNLQIEQERLKTLEDERRKAAERRIEIERNAANRQLAIDAALQASSLTKSAIEIFGSGAKLGLPGILFAVGAVATLFSFVARAKAQAAQFATPDELRGGGLFDGPNLLSHEQQRKRGRYHRIEGSNLAIERGEWIIGTKHSKEHSHFLADLNSGKYTGIDLAANLEFARSLSKRSRAIRSGSDGQMVKDIMRRASGYDRLEKKLDGVISAVNEVQSEVKRKPTVIPSGRNQIIIEDGLHQSSRIVEIK